MGRVTVYLDDEIEAKMAARASAQNLSKSDWIAKVLREKLRNEWPAEVREIAGTWRDFPSLEQLRDEA